MDRRQQKTRNAIFQAFRELLEIKNFNHITVQDIIDRADIGRSTFYSHFETKDELLRAMCTDIFEHVFSSELNREISHDFSHADEGLRPRLTHLLYHIKDNGNNLISILSCDSCELFMNYFKSYLEDIFRPYAENFEGSVPQDFVLHQLTGSFSEMILWWVKHKMKEQPEEMISYFYAIIHIE